MSLRDVDGLALERASRREADDLRGELRRRALVVDEGVVDDGREEVAEQRVLAAGVVEVKLAVA